jgi:hypothetical protein
VFFLISVSNFTFTLQGFSGNHILVLFQLEHDAALLILHQQKLGGVGKSGNSTGQLGRLLPAVNLPNDISVSLLNKVHM